MGGITEEHGYYLPSQLRLTMFIGLCRLQGSNLIQRRELPQSCVLREEARQERRMLCHMGSRRGLLPNRGPSTNMDLQQRREVPRQVCCGPGTVPSDYLPRWPQGAHAWALFCVYGPCSTHRHPSERCNMPGCIRGCHRI